MDSKLREFFDKKNVGSEDGKSIEEWILSASSRANQLAFATHNGKYTHSGAKKEVSCIAKEKNAVNDGFFRTGNCIVSNIQSLKKLDCLGNAASLDVYAFLSVELEDGQSVLAHLEKRTAYIRKELGLEENAFNEICEHFLSIIPDGKNMKTSDLIKQVYFPVDEEYHLLSILTPSCLITEMKARIDKEWRYSSDTKEGREARRKNTYHMGYSELYNLTEIAYGGTKAQNIGVLNNKNGGVSYLLPSFPPSLQERTTRLPKRNFFNDCLRRNDFEDLYTSLYRIFGTDYNNLAIRDARERLFKAVIDRIIQKAWDVKNNPGTWSKRDYYSQLPQHQKIWLDATYNETRSEDDSWLPKIIEEMSRWICSYTHPSKNIELSLLGDDELLYVRSLVEETKEALL